MVKLVQSFCKWKNPIESIHLHNTEGQSSSTWTKSPHWGRFYALWGRFCDLRDLGGDFSFQGGFLQVEKI